MQAVERRIFLEIDGEITAFLNRAEQQPEGFILITERRPDSCCNILVEVQRFDPALQILEQPCASALSASSSIAFIAALRAGRSTSRKDFAPKMPRCSQAVESPAQAAAYSASSPMARSKWPIASFKSASLSRCR